MNKIETLCEIEGMTVEEMMQESLFGDGPGDPGICMNEGCEYTTHVEPDSATGWCEECKTNTVKSISRLLGVI